MKNDLLTIGGLTVHGYGLMIGIGFAAAYLMTEYRAKKRGMDSDIILSMAFYTIVSGLVSAKLLYYATVFDEILEDPGMLLDLGDGFVVYGGIIGGVLGGWLFCRIKKIPFFAYFDLAAPAVALAQGFGRIGCFLAGCCYGLQMETPFSIVFMNSDFAPNGVPLLPVQLMASGLDFIHCLFLVAASRRLKADGQTAALYLICYSIGRFALEFLRGDLIRGSVGRLSTSQFISLFILAGGIALFVAAPRIQGKKGNSDKGI